MDIRPIVVDARTRREHLREKTVTGLQTLFPLVGRDHDLAVENVRVKPAAYSSNDQKTAILHGRTLSEPVVGDLVMRDKSGKIIDSKKGHILAHLPYFTERHSMIVGGNEYEVPNQLRLKPGVYTRERGNGEFEAAFNLSKGDNFRISMEPETGKLKAEFGTTSVPLRPVLKALGVSDATMKQHWGAELHEANLSSRATSEEGALNKLVGRLKRPRDVVADTPEAKQRFLHEYFDSTRMDPDVNKRTLGHGFDRVTPMAMLEASKKLVRVHKGEDEGDDRDSLEFKTIHTIDDFFQERLSKDAKRTVAPKLVWKMNNARGRTLKEVMPNSMFTRSLTSFLTTSALAAIPTQYNPVELIDHASKITSLGEGGISSDRAIPFEARKVHNTHLGVLDPVRTPESGHAGIDVRAAMGAHKDKHGNLYGTFRNGKTGKVEPVSVMTLASATIGFSGQEHRKGKVDAIKGADVVSVPHAQVDYWIHDPTHQFSPSVALVPFLDGMQGNRAIMGSKFQTQALPLLERDVPYVQAQAPRSTESMTKEIARLTVPTSAVHGTIMKVDKDYIYIRPDKTKTAGRSIEERLARMERRRTGTETDEERAEYARMDAADKDSEYGGGCLKIPTSGVHGTIAKVDANYYVRPDTQKRAADTDFEAAASVYAHHIQKQLQQLPNAPRAVFYAQPGVDAQSLPTLALETHFVLPSGLSAHTHGEYKGQRPTSFLNPALPRGFTTVLKQRGDRVVPKIDWTFLDPAARGQGLASAYYRGIEEAARQLGHPELQVDASEGGLAYWARPEFGLTTAPAAARTRAAAQGGSIIYHKHLQPDTLKVADYDGLDDAQIPEYLMGDAKTAAADDDDGLIRLPYDTHFPLAAKTYLHNTVKVKAGDRVTPGQQLADSNFTKDDHIALGKNLTTGYLAYYGKNSNDAVVISESAAKKLTSEHMYKETLRKGSDTIQSKGKYGTYYGMRFTKAQLDKLDEQGIAKPGVRLDPGDPVILALEKSSPSPDALMLGHLHKSLVKPYRDASVVWEHHTPGEVVEAVNAARQAVCTVRTHEPMKIGDKLANRFGGKGVVSEIIPDHKMIQDERKKPIDVLFTSAGIVSRINPAQVVEAALGKVVEKTGKPYVLEQFMREDNVAFAKKELAKHGVKDKETVYDPMSGRNIPNVFVGRSYIHKLFKSTESNYAARGVSNYDVNLQPTKGGDEGAKGLGKMEINTLLAHNARNVLKDALTVKSEKSDDYWRALEFGLPPPPPKSPFVTEKFKAMMTGAGINVDKRGTNIALGALTDKHVTDMSSGALTLPDLEKSKSFMVTAKDLKPEKGGLFDPVLTGGLSGTRWAHIDLPEPLLNPVFEDPARRLLGMTKAQLRTELSSGGGATLRTKLNAIDLAAHEKKLTKKSETARGAELDNVVKQLKYVRALREAGHTGAGDAYVVSKIPVIPPIMRPILPSQKNGELQIADANYLYRDLALAASGLKAAKETGLTDLTASARSHMYDASSALAGIGDPVSPQLQGRGVTGFITQISGQGSPKQGFLFKKILKRQQDLSMRATATPDNTLDMDQIGVPEDMLWKTYDKFVMKGLIGQGYAATRAKEMIEERHPMAGQVLRQELAIRPVFVNRAPSLHKHNMVAAFPVAVPGKSLRINPFMEKGQNLDYDGDTMQLHVPVSNKAVAEARELTLSKLLFSDKSRDDLMIFPQHEAIIGTYLATAHAASGPKKKFKTKADAMAAYRRGEITLKTPVEIG